MALKPSTIKLMYGKLNPKFAIQGFSKIIDANNDVNALSALGDDLGNLARYVSKASASGDTSEAILNAMRPTYNASGFATAPTGVLAKMFRKLTSYNIPQGALPQVDDGISEYMKLLRQVYR